MVNTLSLRSMYSTAPDADGMQLRPAAGSPAGTAGRPGTARRRRRSAATRSSMHLLAPRAAGAAGSSVRVLRFVSAHRVWGTQ